MTATISHPQVSELLVRWRDGDHAALEVLVPLVYDELRRLARSYLRREMPGQSIQSAALVMKLTCAWWGRTRRNGRIAPTFLESLRV